MLDSIGMKDSIHPQYNKDAKITCACGNVLTVGSTKGEIHVEICSNCHPFYTGKQKLIDTTGRVQKFQERLAKFSEKAATKTEKKPRKTKEEKAASK